MAFPYGAGVVVHYGAVEIDAVAVVLLHELQAPLVEAIEPPVPNVGIGDCVHYQLCCSIAIRAQGKHKRV